MSNKKQVFYIHGGDSYTSYELFLEDLKTRTIRDLPSAEKSDFWSRSLPEELGDDYEVFAPNMPNKQNAHYEEWKIWFERHFEYLHDEVILVGWSLGAIFFAKYLSENEVPFKVSKLILLAAPFNTLELRDPECGDFVLDPELVSDLTKKVGHVTLMHSKDDFVVPYEQVLVYQRLLITADLLTFEDKNHFLVEELPELLELIRD